MSVIAIIVLGSLTQGTGMEEGYKSGFYAERINVDTMGVCEDLCTGQRLHSSISSSQLSVTLPGLTVSSSLINMFLHLKTLSMYVDLWRRGLCVS